MPVSEFDLIRQYFAHATASRDDVLIGIGDDCALLQPAAGETLAVSIDTLVEGRHFAVDADPAALGHKALAVNLSDLAAMGASPAWATLALTLPAADTLWIEAFMRGFSTLAGVHRVQLVGGDTTRGPRTITVQVHGFVAAAEALRRDAGRPGDRLLVSGSLGDAALALRLCRISVDRYLKILLQLEPRLEALEAEIGKPLEELTQKEARHWNGHYMRRCAEETPPKLGIDRKRAYLPEGTQGGGFPGGCPEGLLFL